MQIVRQRASQPRHEPLSQGQKRIWRLLELDQTSAVYNLGFAYELKGPLDVGALEKSLQNLTERHEALRLGFAVIDDMPVQVIDPEMAVRFLARST